MDPEPPRDPGLIKALLVGGRHHGETVNVNGSPIPFGLVFPIIPDIFAVFAENPGILPTTLPETEHYKHLPVLSHGRRVHAYFQSAPTMDDLLEAALIAAGVLPPKEEK